MAVNNLGIIAAIHIGATSPQNTKMLWFNTGDNSHYFYNFATTSWVKLDTGGGGSSTAQVMANKTIGAGHTPLTIPVTMPHARYAVQFMDNVSGAERSGFFVSGRTTTIVTVYAAAQETGVDLILIP